MEFSTWKGWQELLLGIMRSIKHVTRAFKGQCDPLFKTGLDASPSSSAVKEGWLNRLPYKMANQVPIRSAPHVLPSQVLRACHGLAAVTLGGAYAAVPVRRVLPARLNVFIRSMAACGVWSGCRGQAAPDVKENQRLAAYGAASGYWHSLAVFHRSAGGVFFCLRPPESSTNAQPRRGTAPKHDG